MTLHELRQSITLPPCRHRPLWLTCVRAHVKKMICNRMRLFTTDSQLFCTADESSNKWALLDAVEVQIQDLLEALKGAEGATTKASFTTVVAAKNKLRALEVRVET